MQLQGAVVDEKLDVQAALKRALKSAIVVDGLSKGLHEAAKALDKFIFISFIFHFHSLIHFFSYWMK